ncbi:predicted protein [Naegleria gruberi]|uniref:Predicted protein n=1 Tax=Naegleria gruberi TaxID=5762 RepID=D2V1G6_NAEGR|nr:uncharacterized protein NAEGRDRAFT_62572 [Naegleria gruberi]EFC49162.1 predicted protein [Naegleria gruberi]|eukprot:XP_002681906.1 predicted protein [Naegleria gruberi strain NEG-M]
MIRRGLNLLISHQSSSSLIQQQQYIKRFASVAASKLANSFYELKAQDIKGKVTEFKSFEGKVCLIVNVDEDELIRMKVKHQITHPEEFKQLMELRELIHKFENKEFSIIAFPTREAEVTHEHVAPEYTLDDVLLDNDKKASKIIGKDVFTVMRPVHLNTMKEHQVYAYLKYQAEELEKKIVKHPEELKGEDISINEMFTKFLINRKGEVVARFGKNVEPQQLAFLIEQLLKE